MAKKRANETITKAVASAQASADPGAYASRYQFTMDGGGTIVPRSDPSSIPPALKGIQFRRNTENELEAYVPALAGGMGMPGMSSGGWDSDSFANWESNVPSTDGKGDIRKALKFWKKDPLVFKCVKVEAQLANSRFSIECEDEEFKAIVEGWVEKAMGHGFRKAFFQEFFRSSMVPIIKTLIPYKPRDYKKGKVPKTQDGMVLAHAKTDEIVDRNEKTAAEYTAAFAAWSQAGEMHKKGLCSVERLDKLQAAMAASQYQWLAGQIAGNYTILNPMDVDIEGPAEMPWLRQPYLRVSSDLRTAVDSPTPQQRDVLAKLSTEIVQQIKAGSDKIWLSPNICSVVYGEKQPYERYPTPIAIHAEDAIDMKIMLMQMDKATAKSMRDRILKVTIGNDACPVYDPAQLQSLAQVFNNPSRNLTIFWDHTLQIEWIEPKNATFNDTGKYETWNAEIRTAYGISAVITGTSDKTGSIGNSMLNLKGVKEEVEDSQNCFLEWFDKEVNLLRQALGVKWPVKGKFDRLNLEDEVQFMTLLMQLVQNGIIDHQTAIETMNFNFPVIQKRQEMIKKLQKKGEGIFLAQPSANNLGPAAMQKKGGLPTGGRPAKQPSSTKKNKQKAGKPAAKKAKAKLVHGDDGITAYMVVQSKSMSPEDRELVSEKFTLPTQYVLTEEEYTKATGKKVDWMNKLPALTTGESVQVMQEVSDFMAAVAKDVDTEIEAMKQGSDGKRGKYRTPKLAGEVTEGVISRCLAGLKPLFVPVEEWDQRMAKACQELPDGTASGQQKVMVGMNLAKQYAKAQSKMA